MRSQTVVLVGVVAVVGGLLIYLVVSGVFLGPTASTSQSSTNQSSEVPPYGCAKPANESEYSCDTLPPGYQIAPRLPNAPEYTCSSKLTPSACELMQQTWGNGVCDPNETVWTAPLDCGCTAPLMGDTWTGRCGNPVQSCQLRALNQTAP